MTRIFRNKLDGVIRNRVVYEKVAEKLCEEGYEYTWKQCKTKVKNLMQRYRKLKDNNRKSGQGHTTCPFYDQLDAVLGSRAASEPPVILESLNENSTTISDLTGYEEDISGDTQNTAPESNEDGGLNDSGSSAHHSSSQCADESDNLSSKASPAPSASSATSATSQKKGKMLCGMKRKGNKDREDMVAKIIKLEEEVEKREDKREGQRVEMLERMEECWQKQEEERAARDAQMLSLFTSFLGQMPQVLTMYGPAFPNYPAHFPPPFMPPTDCPPFHPPQNPQDSCHDQQPYEDDN